MEAFSRHFVKVYGEGKNKKEKNGIKKRYDIKKMPDMLAYYRGKGCEVKTLAECVGSNQ